MTTEPDNDAWMSQQLGNVVHVSFERPHEAVMSQAAAAGVRELIIIGWDRDGNFWSETTLKDGGDALWLLEEAKRKLMEAGR